MDELLNKTVRFGDEVFTAAPEPGGRGDQCRGCAFDYSRDGDQEKRARCQTAGNCSGIIFVARAADNTAAQGSMILSEDPAIRKGTPITTGVLDYFPRALAAVAQCSKAGNDQHNPGQPLRWDRTKSTDHADCIARHLIDRDTVDTDGIPHAAKLAWRALALLETMLEAEQKQ